MTFRRAYVMACHGNAGIKNSQSDENMEPTPLKPTRSNLYGIFPPLFARQPFVVKSIVYMLLLLPWLVEHSGWYS